jgi:hypothetical protein
MFLGIQRQMCSLGMKTAYDFVVYPSKDIQKYFSEPLYVLQQELKGISMHTLNYDTDPRDQKSIQSTATFKPPSDDPKVIFAELSDNIEQACEHARRLDLMTNSVSFFVKNTKFIHHSGDAKLPLYTNNPSIILTAVEQVFKTVLHGDVIRSTGITLHNLRRTEDVPNDLFGIKEKADSKNIIEEVGDAIRQKFGHGALKRASSLKSTGKQRWNSFPKRI